MARYSIEDTTLTAIGDAVREKSGKLTKEGYVDAGKFVVENLLKNRYESYYFPSGTKKVKIKKIYFGNHVPVSVIDNTGSSLLTPEGYTLGWDFYKEEITELVAESDKGLSSFQVYNNGAYNNDAAFNGEFEITSYDVDGNVIQVLGEVKNTMTPMQMAETINETLEAIPQEAFYLSGKCNYRFAYGGWDWFIDMFKDKITTSNINDCNYMFANSKSESIPFDINVSADGFAGNFSYMFQSANKLKEIPLIKGDLKVPTSNYSNNPAMTSMFDGCHNLRHIPYDYFDNFGGEAFWTAAKAFNAYRQTMFKDCYSLRNLPNLSNLETVCAASYNYSSLLYYQMCSMCSVLDEIRDLPVLNLEKTTNNCFVSTFDTTRRLKALTFKTNEDGSPIVAKMQKQTIDLSSKVGYVDSTWDHSMITSNNSGITEDKCMKDDATYQALKDDPDCYALHMDYGRYNHDSAVETINSLPDTSAFVAEKGSTNTIKFKGAAGAKTDGGAINTLTEEEIAVATAKGWTVSLV